MELNFFPWFKKMAEPPSLNASLQAISRRAERLDPKQQAETYVSLGGIEHTLLNPDHSIIYGRRGTGKTHIISFVASRARSNGDIAVVIDLRTIGSNGYIYADESLPITERATRILRDFTAAIHDALLENFTAPSSTLKIDRFSSALDALADSVKEVIVREQVEEKIGSQTSDAISGSAEGKISLSPASLGGGVIAKGEARHTIADNREYLVKGRPTLSINIGGASKALAQIGIRLQSRVWFMIDEWSTVPEVLQPFLADYIKRVLFPIQNFSVHIAAIEQRANFRIGEGATSIGIELGSDAFADVNLDDQLVLENDAEKATNFFKQLIFRHFNAVHTAAGGKAFDTADEFVRNAFTQEPAFRELVRACEGVPRDAINILQIAATRAQDERISVSHIRSAAHDWYERDKASYLNNNQQAAELLHWIIESVIGARRARAFLVRSDLRNDILERLFDERILHIAKRSYSAKDEAGTRYKVWKLDYGSYVDLINTSRAPIAFLPNAETTSEASINVPEDDFRAIRRSILDIDSFYAQRSIDPP
ncbi:ATP-binding protein [Microvirga pudoricolor]|uniref:hypothetical protein n=1 Tax=Microvirga pudoricolor TaxID=2778729 RepID=UPI0019505A6B|nr:hypothetical protein [Microvirga pudoricolor]MBM6596607.1 hypothetical protein [Microvirga pudoricolor]